MSIPSSVATAVAAAERLWLILIGWFLSNASKASYVQAVVLEALQDVPVRRFMDTRFDTVQPDTTVSSLVHEQLLRREQRTYPVVAGQELLGVVGLDDVKKLSEHEWGHTSVRAIMTPRERPSVVEADLSAAEALRIFSRLGVKELPVTQDGRLAGMLRQEQLLRWLSLQLQNARPNPAA